MPITQAEANKDRTSHQFAGKLGYIKHTTPLPKPGPRVVAKDASPPASAKNGSRHVLLPPTGGEPIAFEWIAKDRLWARDGANRLGFSVAHLSAHGWAYVGPEPKKES